MDIMVSIMKSLTQITYSCFTLILAFACISAHAQNMDSTTKQESSHVSEVVIPLSGQEIKKNLADPKRGTSMM